MEGTGSPICFSSLACRVCQAGGQASCVQCVSSSGCGLLQSWGKCVIVGRRGAKGKAKAPNTGTGYVNVLIDRHDSMVGNPFVKGPIERLCRAFDELLSHVLLNDMDFDRVLQQYHRLHDEHCSGLAHSEPVLRRLLVDISRRHEVGLH